MKKEESYIKWETCQAVIEYGCSHQCYSDIYTKLFNSICLNQKTDLDSLEKKLKTILGDLKGRISVAKCLIDIREIKKEELRDIK